MMRCDERLDIGDELDIGHAGQYVRDHTRMSNDFAGVIPVLRERPRAAIFCGMAVGARINLTLLAIV